MARETDGVEKLKDKLYSRNNTDSIQGVRSPLPASDAKASVAWGEPPKPPKRPGTDQFEGGMGDKPPKRGMSVATGESSRGYKLPGFAQGVKAGAVLPPERARAAR